MRLTALLLVIPTILAAQSPQPAPSVLSTEQLIVARKFDEAKPAVQAALARDKNDPNALYLMGRLVYAQGNSGEGVDWFEKAIARNSKIATYHTWLGNALGDETQRASKFRQPFLAKTEHQFANWAKLRIAEGGS